MTKNLFIILILLVSSSVKAEEFTGNYNYSLDDTTYNGDCNDLKDPFESVNRKIFYFNSFLDLIITKPMAVAYNKMMSDYSKNRVNDFVSNISEPVTTINYGLQGNLTKSLTSFWRFFINTTFGAAGTYDAATDLGITARPQNFGATLAHYGVEAGPYIVLPILGSTNLRDMWDVIALDSKTNIVRVNLPESVDNVFTGVKIVSYRANILPFTEYISKNSTDPYVGIRSALHQRRESVISYPKGYVCGKRPVK